MPLSVGDILTVKHFQSKDSQMILNVFNYEVASVEDALISGYADLAHGFYSTFSAAIRDLQVPGLTHVRTIVEELEGVEYGEFIPDTAVTGAQNTDAMPIFCAASIQYVRSSKITRHGWKRIGGVAEFFQTANVLTSGALDILQGAIDVTMNPAGFLLEQLNTSDEGSGEVGLFPVIVGLPVPSAPTIYRVQRPANVVPRTLVTTQNTRKIGRGA